MRWMALGKAGEDAAVEESSQPLLINKSTPPQGTSRRRGWAIAIFVTTAAFVALAFPHGAGTRKAEGAVFDVKAPVSTASSEETKMAPDGIEELEISNEWERSSNRKIADAMPGNVVQLHKPTRIRLASGKHATWVVESATGRGNTDRRVAESPVESIEHTFAHVGKYTVLATVLPSAGANGAGEQSVEAEGAKVFRFEILVKAVRYELRELSDEDREAYFKALRIFYVTSPEEGLKKYGPRYMSCFEIVRMHLYGAADKECDHWHDDAGFLTHHVGITWAFENSLRMIDPTTAAHYWDYTRDASREESGGLEWYQSPVFHDDWFGSNSPNNEHHIVDTGRFAYTPVMKNARGYSKITNPYGLLRSPWNTNKNPYLMRYNKTFFSLADGYSYFPDCTEFAEYVGSDLADINAALDTALHGPVHLMVGGHWGSSNNWKNIIASAPEKMLLLSKVMWREGFIRLPEYCTEDTPQSECMPHCPAHILAPDGKELTNERAIEILDKVSIFGLGFSEGPAYYKKLFEAHGGTLDFKDLLLELCHFGFPGEMFTSSAPQDPLFWPLHGNAERFVQYLRKLKKDGTITFNESWGYHFSTDIASETGRICDWSEVHDAYTMPNCTFGTCPGHREDDLLPFENLYEEQTGLLSNRALYEYVSPFNVDLPYVYDSVSYWKGCTNNSLLDES